MDKEEKKMNREKWGDRIAEWKASGLTQAEYCRRNDFKISMFLYWKKKISEKKADFSGFVQVPMNSGIRTCPIRIEVGNRYCIEVGKGYDRGALEHILGLLSQA